MPMGTRLESSAARTGEEAVMSRTRTLVLAGLALTVTASAVRAEVAAPPETKKQRDARMAWWRQARFGMFIHWGLYAVPAAEYKGQRDNAIRQCTTDHLHIPPPAH